MPTTMAALTLVGIFLSATVSLCTGAPSDHESCYKELTPPLPSRILTKPPYYVTNKQDLPSQFDWRTTNRLAAPTNQFLPSPCGSCWAHAALGALEDRMAIASSPQTTIIPLSAQVLLDCPDPDLGSCHGGSALGAYKFIHDNGITDITCSPYMGVDNYYWGEMPCADTMCRKCDRFGKCQFVNGTKYHVKEYGTVSGEDEMKSEIVSRGPIACSVYAHSSAFENYSTGIIQDPASYNFTTHVVVITGWGELSSGGMKYWIGRNSFGTVWGENGWFKLQRGVNALDIEAHTCAWAVPTL